MKLSAVEAEHFKVVLQLCFKYVELGILRESESEGLKLLLQALKATNLQRFAFIVVLISWLPYERQCLISYENYQFFSFVFLQAFLVNHVLRLGHSSIFYFWLGVWQCWMSCFWHRHLVAVTVTMFGPIHFDQLLLLSGMLVIFLRCTCFNPVFVLF